MPKQYGMKRDEMKLLAPMRGYCLATDRITVDLHFVGFMYREEPDSDSDSGWRCFAGDESPEYTDNPSHFEIYDVNTVANYDPAIIPHLDAPIYSAFERSAKDAPFAATDFPGNDHPD